MFISQCATGSSQTLDNATSVREFLQKQGPADLSSWKGARDRVSYLTTTNTLTRVEGVNHILVRFYRPDCSPLDYGYMDVQVMDCGGQLVFNAEGEDGAKIVRPLLDLVNQVQRERVSQIGQLIDHANNRASVPKVEALRRLGTDEVLDICCEDHLSGERPVAGFSGRVGDIEISVLKLHRPSAIFPGWQATLTNSPDLCVAGAVRHYSGGDARSVYRMLSAAYAGEYPRGFAEKLQDAYRTHLMSVENRLAHAVFAYQLHHERFELDRILGCARSLRTQGKDPLLVSPTLEPLMLELVRGDDLSLMRIAAVVLSSSQSPETVGALADNWNRVPLGFASATMLASLQEIASHASSNPALQSSVQKALSGAQDWLEAHVDEEHYLFHSRVSLKGFFQRGSLSQLLSGDGITEVDGNATTSWLNARMA